MFKNLSSSTIFVSGEATNPTPTPGVWKLSARKEKELYNFVSKLKLLMWKVYILNTMQQLSV